MTSSLRNTSTTRRQVVQSTALGVTAAAGAGFLSRAAAATIEPEGTAEASPAASPAVAPGAGGSLVVYCGRNEKLIGGLIPEIEKATGVTLDVRYGNTAELAAQILEEGKNTPAGLYFGQDAGSLGALAKEGRLAPLPQATLDLVDARFRSPEGRWVGVSGRARVLIYNPEVTDPATLPATIAELPKTEVGSLAWAPTNASFQSFVTAMRVLDGEDATRSWLEAMIEAGTQTYEGNAQIRDAVAAREVNVGLVNHYYLYEALMENPAFSAANYYFPNGDLGSLINVAGVGVIADSGQDDAAHAVTAFLLGTQAQTYFADTTAEYPLAAGVPALPELPPLDSFQTPNLDLSDLDDLAGTVTLLTDVGLI